jgi:hypothetical protein
MLPLPNYLVLSGPKKMPFWDTFSVICPDDAGYKQFRHLKGISLITGGCMVDDSHPKVGMYHG